MRASGPSGHMPASLALMAAAAALLLAFLVWDGWRLERPPAPGWSLPLPGPARPSAVPRPAPAEAYDGVVERSLFTPERRAGFASVGGAGGQGRYALRGIVAGPSGALALFEPVAGGPLLRVRQGDRLGRDMVMRIDSDRVLLADARGGHRSLRLADAPAPSNTGAAPPPGPQPGMGEVGNPRGGDASGDFP